MQAACAIHYFICNERLVALLHVILFIYATQSNRRCFETFTRKRSAVLSLAKTFSFPCRCSNITSKNNHQLLTIHHRNRTWNISPYWWAKPLVKWPRCRVQIIDKLPEAIMAPLSIYNKGQTSFCREQWAFTSYPQCSSQGSLPFGQNARFMVMWGI